MRNVINITSPGTRWRVYEKECLEKHFGPVIDLQLGDLEKSKKISKLSSKETVIFWRLNSDSITREELHSALLQREVFKNLNMINDPANHLHIHAKESAFKEWSNEKISIPEFQEFEKKEDIKLKFPYLIRLNNQVTGYSSFLVNNESELDSSFKILENDFKSSILQKPFTKKIAVKFINASKENDKYNLSYRVIVSGDKVVTGYARLSPSSDWVAITGKFDISMGDLFIKYQERCQKMIETHHDEIVRAVKSIGMNLQGVDIIEDQEEKIYFLECQPGFSTGYSDWPAPFYNPHQRDLVDFILQNRNKFKTRCPLYYNKWLNKYNLFNNIFKNLKDSFDNK